MRANPELQEKLQKRLSLQNEQLSPPKAAPPSPVVRPLQLSPPAGSPRGSPQSRPAASPPTGSPRVASLREKLEAVEGERDKALERRKRREEEDVHRAIELSSEVARLRVDVEVLRRDLEEARKEVHQLKARAQRDRAHDQQMAEQAVHQDLQLAMAEARVEDLSSHLACSAEERSLLHDRVTSLEEEVASHVVGRVRLEAQLRKSEAREVEMKKLLSAAELERAGARRHSGGPVCTFAMHDGDEEEVIAEAEEEGDGADAQYMDDDLEYSYEVAELAGSMSLDRALRLARLGGLLPEGAPAAEDARTPAAGEQPAGEAAEAFAEDAYEAPLRELELALARLRGGAGSGGAEDPDGVCALGAGAGTGEAADFDQNLGLLQEVLGRLKPEMPVRPSEPELQPKKLAFAPQGEEEEEPRPPPPAAGQETRLPPPAAPAAQAASEPTPAPASSEPARGQEPPGPRPAQPTEPTSAQGLGEPAPPRPVQPTEPTSALGLGEPTLGQRAQLVGFGGLFSPYARLGQKYAANLP